MEDLDRRPPMVAIQVLIVVTIILIIAAFTIPKITKSQIPAHEASAIASIKAINFSGEPYWACVASGSAAKSG